MSIALQQELVGTLRSNDAYMQSVDAALNQVFSTPEQTRTHKARAIMGDVVGQLTDEELEVCITEFQYLLDTWFDEFERQQFDGSTLKELIME